MAFEQESSGTSLLGTPADGDTPSAPAQNRREVALWSRVVEALAALPPVGSNFLGFQLIAELGRGTFGRVYLARQGDLANRAVALKISVDLASESQLLAQLQH